MGSVTICRSTANDNHSALISEKQPVNQSIYQQEMPEVINQKMFFDAIDLFVITPAHASITNQCIDWRVQAANRIRTRDD